LCLGFAQQIISWLFGRTANASYKDDKGHKRIVSNSIIAEKTNFTLLKNNNNNKSCIHIRRNITTNISATNKNNNNNKKVLTDKDCAYNNIKNNWFVVNSAFWIKY